MSPLLHAWIAPLPIAVLLSITTSTAASAPASGVHEQLARLLSAFDEQSVTTGVLYDRTVSLVGHRRFDGGSGAPPADLRIWRQLLHEVRHAALDPDGWPRPVDLIETVAEERSGAIPLAVMNVEYQYLRRSALDDGTLEVQGDRLVPAAGAATDPLTQSRVVAAAALKERSAQGLRQGFVLARDRYLTNDPRGVDALEIDLDDGRGFRPFDFDEAVVARYAGTGSKVLRIRLVLEDGTKLLAGFTFEVAALQAPSPDDTLSVTSTIPYAGGFASGDAYVYLAEGRTQIVDPVVAIEGFDIENNLDWEEIYEILNQQALVETLRSMGYDIVVLNFTDSTDYIQRNGLLVMELIQQIEARIDPARTFPLVGASLGALAARYALAYLETEGIAHRVRNLISFDGPHGGANIPLGIQYWLDFFSDLSADANFLLSRLDTPASRQLLVYHHTTPAGATGESDPLRADFLADLAGVGDYPANVRKVAIANGSSTQMDQGYAAGAQIIQYEYDSLLVDIVGNVWSVPDGASQTIFDGRIFVFLVQNEAMSVTVAATLPYDNAPGGYRASMAQMDSVTAPYGDIVALHANHAFIPTISALALDHTSNPFHDVAGDPDLLSHTPFDDVFVPLVNEGHVSVSAELVPWLIAEISRSPTASFPVAVAGRPVLYPNAPNPFNPRTTIRFSLGHVSPVTLAIYDARGRLVEMVLDGQVRGPGLHEVVWPGGHARDAAGASTGRGAAGVASGVYFYRLTTPTTSLVRKMVMVE